MLKQSKKHGLSGEEEKNSVEPVRVESYESLGAKTAITMLCTSDSVTQEYARKWSLIHWSTWFVQ